MLKDFTNKPVIKIVGVDQLCFGRVKNQEQRRGWLWLDVEWKSGPKLIKVATWQRCDAIRVIDREQLIDDLESL
tara:strand:- start:101 stop:322 length:222 start_codon:yes stop_codon:yes gene_type:complete